MERGRRKMKASDSFMVWKPNTAHRKAHTLWIDRDECGKPFQKGSVLKKTMINKIFRSFGCWLAIISIKKKTVCYHSIILH
jgi:hypothetical protein